MTPSEPSGEGQTQEFVRLLSRHEREIYAFILSVVPNWADADEILQETTVRLWQEFEKFESGTSFVAWGCRVAHYQILTFRKKMGRERVMFSQAFLEQVSGEFEEHARGTDRRRDALSHCLERLPEKSRSLLRQVYSGGYSIRSLAEKLGRTETALYKSLSRTRFALHDCIRRALKEGAT